MSKTSNVKSNIKHAQTINAADIATLLDANLESGLSENEVNHRITKYGLNSFTQQKQKSIWLLLIEQFNSPIIFLLIAAAGFSFFFKDYIEGFSIIGVIFITAALGFIMELQARN